MLIMIRMNHMCYFMFYFIPDVYYIILWLFVLYYFIFTNIFRLFNEHFRKMHLILWHGYSIVSVFQLIFVLEFVSCVLKDLKY